MKTKSVTWNIVMIVLFAGIALTEFIENVRIVQIVGLLVCGAGLGVSVMRLLQALKRGEAKS